jgi:guanylate kinase
MRQGFVLVISGPSGAGKTSIAHALARSLPGMAFSVSATTRAPRPGETDGVDYVFCDREQFQGMIERGELLEWASYAGNLYGTPRAPVEAALAQGIDIILDIETTGAHNVRRAMPGSVLVFVVPPRFADLRRRIVARSGVGEAELARRLAQARSEMALAAEYDYVVVNEVLAEAVEQVRAVVVAERCRAARQQLLESSWTEGGGAG